MTSTHINFFHAIDELNTRVAGGQVTRYVMLVELQDSTSCAIARADLGDGEPRSGVLELHDGTTVGDLLTALDDLGLGGFAEYIRDELEVSEDTPLSALGG